MPVSLDILLFWAGLVITLTGLVVFVLGRSKSDAAKQGDNRFEAFGIKIDVSNPSLLLVILGVVMMLVPKMIPQQGQDPTAQPTSLEPAATGAAAPLAITAPPPATSPEPAPASAEVPQETRAAAPVQPPAGERDDAPVVRMAGTGPGVPVEMAESLPAGTAGLTVDQPPQAPVAPPPPGKQSPAAVPAPSRERSPAVTEAPRAGGEAGTPKPVQERPTAARQSDPKIGSARPAPVRTLARAKPVEPESPPPATPPRPRTVVLLARADADSRAGITGETHASFTRKLAAEMERRLDDQRAADLVSRREKVSDLRDYLRDDGERLQLCDRFGTELLLIGDLSIPFAMGNVESAYWPDLGLYLVDCGRRVTRQRTESHLAPRYDDSFPFQVAIGRTLSSFLEANGDLLAR